MNMELRFRIVKTSLEKNSLVLLVLKNLDILDNIESKIKPNTETLDLQKMTEQVFSILQQKFQMVKPFSYSYLFITLEQYEKMGKPVIGDELVFNVKEVQN